MRFVKSLEKSRHSLDFHGPLGYIGLSIPAKPLLVAIQERSNVAGFSVSRRGVA